MDTLALVKQARLGDKDALLMLIMTQQQDYYRLAYTFMGNQEDTMDAMEDMIVGLYENISRLKKPEAFYSWSKTILVNSCRKLLRNRKKLLVIEKIPADSTFISQEEFGPMLQQLTMEKHLSMLSVKQKEVLKLRYYLDLDYKEIALLLNVPLGTVKSRISLGLKQLAANLGGEDLD